MLWPMRAVIAERRPGLLTYGITAPKRDYPEEKRREVAARQAERINALPIDGLVVYDLQDESARTDAERPFPFLECIDPADYAYDYLSEVTVPRVVYRCTANLDADGLAASLRRVDEAGDVSVLVGAPSRDHPSRMRLSDAYELRRSTVPGLPVGGVLIAERDDGAASEHQRVLRKVESGCSFFVTQAVYDVTPTKNVLSDLHHRSADSGTPVPPILVTLTPCGSERTLDFMRWLGIQVPRWLENELRSSPNILRTSVEACMHVATDLLAFARPRGIPLGFNVESVSLRRAEIDASVELTERVAHLRSA